MSQASLLELKAFDMARAAAVHVSTIGAVHFRLLETAVLTTL